MLPLISSVDVLDPWFCHGYTLCKSFLHKHQHIVVSAIVIINASIIMAVVVIILMYLILETIIYYYYYYNKTHLLNT